MAGRLPIRRSGELTAGDGTRRSGACIQPAAGRSSHSSAHPGGSTMPFHYRKSINAGPFRFNLSTGGVGVSVGVRGLRVGTGPRGHYVQVGRGGFSYRATLPPSRTRHEPAHTVRRPPAATLPVDDGMIIVSSADAAGMQDVAFADLLADINAKERQPRMASALTWLAVGFTLVSALAIGPAAGPTILSVPLLWALGRWLDAQRRVVPLMYDVDEAPDAAYPRICAAFDGLAACRGMWHVEAGKAVSDLTTWKRQAGASHLVRRTPTTVGYDLPKVLRCNVTPPTLRMGGRTFHFLPDAVLVRDATGYGAVGYDTLRLSHQNSNFIESGVVPGDAVISHHTWEHPNRDGGPDRRFRSNRRLPVCRYESMHLGSASGLNELLEFSRTGVVKPLSDAIASMPRNRNLEARALPAPVEREHASGPRQRPQGSGVSDTGIVASAAALLAVTVVVLAQALPHGSFGTPAATAASGPKTVPADERRYVTAKQLNCRTAPDPTSGIEQTFRHGAPLHIVGLQGDWAEVGGPDEGCWVSLRHLATRHAAGPKRSHRHALRQAETPSVKGAASDVPQSTAPATSGHEATSSVPVEADQTPSPADPSPPQERQ